MVIEPLWRVRCGGSGSLIYASGHRGIASNANQKDVLMAVPQQPHLPPQQAINIRIALCAAGCVAAAQPCGADGRQAV